MEYYRVIVNHYKEEIHDLKAQNVRFSTTLDEATKLTNKRHMNVNIHWNGKVRNLGMISVYGSCPAETAKELYDKRLEYFGLDSYDIVGSSTDGAAVMDKFGRLIPSIHVMCYAHAFHLAICDLLYAREVNPDEDMNENPIEEDVDDEDSEERERDDSEGQVPTSETEDSMDIDDSSGKEMQ